MVPNLPLVERFGNDLGLSDEDRNRIFRTAPITTKGYYDLIDAVHGPASNRTAVENSAEAVAAEINARDVPESTLAIIGLRNRIDSLIERE